MYAYSYLTEDARHALQLTLSRLGPDCRVETSQQDCDVALRIVFGCNEFMKIEFLRTGQRHS